MERSICPFCNRIGTELSNLITHKENVHGLKKVDSSLTPYQLKKKMLRSKLIVSLVDIGSQIKVECIDCGQYMSVSEMKTHHLMHFFNEGEIVLQGQEQLEHCTPKSKIIPTKVTFSRNRRMTRSSYIASEGKYKLLPLEFTFRKRRRTFQCQFCVRTFSSLKECNVHEDQPSNCDK